MEANASGVCLAATARMAALHSEKFVPRFSADADGFSGMSLLLRFLSIIHGLAPLEHLERMIVEVQHFTFSGKEIPPRYKTCRKGGDQPLLCRKVEIDHNISTEDDIKIIFQ